MAKKHSAIWEYFSEDEDSKYTVCNECEVKVPRGGSSTKSYTTTNLVYHLSVKHEEIHKQYLKKKANNRVTTKVPKETRKERYNNYRLRRLRTE